MNKFSLCFCAVVVSGLFLYVPYLNAQNKDNADSGDKAKPAVKAADAKPADAKSDVKAAAGNAAKPAADVKPLSHYKKWETETDYGFTEWTDPNKQGEVQGYLNDFITKKLDPLTGTQRDDVLRKSLDILQKMAADASVNPTARYNAVLAAGHLTQSKPRDRNAAPVPYTPALVYLAAQYNKADNPEYIKLGALLGIVRHCAMGITDNNLKTEIPNLLLKVITDGKPAADGDKDAQYIRDCFRIRAVDGLALLGKIRVNGNVMKTFYDILEDTGESTEMRVRASRALGELNYKEAGESSPPVSYETAGLSLLNYAKRLSDEEIQIIDDLLAKTKAETGGVASLGSSMGTGGMSYSAAGTGTANTGPPFDSLPVEKKLEVINVFQRVKSEFADIMHGIRGPRVSASKNVTGGVQSAISENSPVIVKLNRTAAATMTLFRYLDEKDEQAKKFESKKKAGSRGSSTESMSPDEMSMGSGGMSGMSGGANAEADKNMDIKPLKVNLGDIQEALKKFSDELDLIISGSPAAEKKG